MALVDELLQRGREREAAGDFSGAAVAYREADDLGDADGAIMLGDVLRLDLDDPSGAAAAYQRAETRGNPVAAAQLGLLLWQNFADVPGATAAFERSAAAGWGRAALYLGVLLSEQGAAEEALEPLQVALDAGCVEASEAIGRILDERGDLLGAVEAYRRGVEAGDRLAARALGSALTKLEDHDGARQAFERARELGDEEAGQILDELARQHAQAVIEHRQTLAQRYVEASGDVQRRAQACLDVANKAIACREKAAVRPQHEISIRNFTQWAEDAEREFALLYGGFDEACSTARAAAAAYLAASENPMSAETVLMLWADESEINAVWTATRLMSVRLGPSPAVFAQGISQFNQLVESTPDEGPREGNIYGSDFTF